MNKSFCTNCKDLTNHIPKLSAVLDGCLVCDECRKMNGFCILTKVGFDTFQKHSRDVRWIEFENNQGKELHKKIQIGYSLIMSPFDNSFTWMTTEVIDIVEENENLIHFKTKNSEYILYVCKEAIDEFTNNEKED